jgi:hypothetical protein
MSNHDHYLKKIPAYLDGILNTAETSEFEAYLGNHPEFYEIFIQREKEYNQLTRLIPQAEMVLDQQIETLRSEVNEVIHHLFNDPHAGSVQKLKDWLKTARL